MSTEPITPGPQEPRKSWPRRHKGLTVIGTIGAAVVLLVIVGIAGGSKPKPAPTPAAAAAPTSAPAAAAAPTPTPSGPVPPTRVKFIVTGSGAPSIQYGSDSDNRSPAGGLGPLSDGNALPWHATMKFHPGALYYSISAQLEGGGNIKCKIVVTGPGDAPLTVSHGHAQGGYNICSAQAAPSDDGLSWQNEG